MTRDAILDAALEQFAARGYAATTVRAITAAIGLRESSIYNHFDGKEAILKALMTRYGPARSVERLKSAQYTALASSPEAFCRLHAYDKLEEWCDSHEQSFMHLLMFERERLQAEREMFAKSWFKDELGLVTKFFRGFAERDLIIAPDARETARTFMAGLTLIRQEFLILPAVPKSAAKVRPHIDRYLENLFKLILVGKRQDA